MPAAEALVRAARLDDGPAIEALLEQLGFRYAGPEVRLALT